MALDRPVVVLGTGFAGFGAGRRLEAAGRRYLCFDKNAFFGGHTTSFELPGGWVFDDGPHVSFTKTSGSRSILADAVDGRLRDMPAWT